MQEGSDQVKGEIKSVIFYNDENGYAVLRLNVRKKNIIKEMIACGNIYQPFPGELVCLEGRWENNKEYGFQFMFRFFTRKVPQSREGMIKYLSSNMVKGIGKHYAEKIINKFEDASFSIIENEPEKLLEIDGIGEVRLASLKKSWKNQRIIRDIILFLSENKINLNYASKIFKVFGENSIEQLKRDPYVLAEKIRGIGFKTADRIARKLNVREDSHSRIKSGIIYVLLNDTDNGNTMTPEDVLVDQSRELLGLDNHNIEDCLSRLIKEEVLFLIMKNDKNHYSIPAYFFAEIKVSHRLNNILNSKFFIPVKSIDMAIGWVQQKTGLRLTEDQQEAVAGVINNKVSIITGGPGTGKTTIVQAIYSIYKAKKARVALLSPTGKAAKRLGEVTRHRASTIHRILGANPMSGRNVKNEMNRLQYDLIIIDEFSMVDILLFYNLLKAVDDNTKLVFIGDSDQLPSVGPGDVLHCLIRSKKIFVAELNQVFRQKSQSRIISAAHRIKGGKFPYLPSYRVDDRNDIYLYEIDDSPAREDPCCTDNLISEKSFAYGFEKPKDIPGIIIKMIKYDIPRIAKGVSMEDIQVISSMNRGICGTHNLNSVIQDYFNPSNHSIKRFGRTFRKDDKVMQIANNYDKLVFNGDTGIIADIDADNNLLFVRFDGRMVEYDFSELDELTLSYAISVHKSQGSEFPVIIFPIIMSHYIMLRRNLIYTGITRAKRLAILIGSKKAIGIAINKGNVQERKTYLQERIEENLS